VALDASAFQQTVLSFSTTADYVRRYARKLFMALNAINATSMGMAAPVDDVDTVGLDMDQIAYEAFNDFD